MAETIREQMARELGPDPEAPAEDREPSKPENGAEQAEPVDAAPVAATDDEQAEKAGASEAEDGEAEQASDPEQEAPKKRNPMRDHMRKLERENREMREQMQRFIEAQAQKPPGADEPRGDPEKGPQRDDFDDYDTYLEERAAWRAERAIVDRLLAEREALGRQQAEAIAAQAQSEWETRADKVRERYDDFDEVAYVQAPITESMAAVIREMDAGPEVAYHLGKHPDDGQRIAGLSPTRQAIELAKIEVQLAAPAQPPPTPRSNAPPPAEPVKTAGDVAPTGPTDRDSVEAWMKKRQAQRNAARTR